MQLVLDPVVIEPPDFAQRRRWVSQMSELRALLTEECIDGTCPSTLTDPILAKWFEGGKIDAEKGELARIAGEIAARLIDTVDLGGTEILLDQIVTDPAYAPDQIPGPLREEFEEHLADAAFAHQECALHVGVLSPPDSWSRPSDAVLVEASVLGREIPDSEMQEPEGPESELRVFLPRSEAVTEVLKAACAHPCFLVQNLEFGVKAYYAGVLGGDPSDLDFEVGPHLAESIQSMNYSCDPRYAAKCLRAMALIAAGRGQELNGHIERRGAGGNNEFFKDDAGNNVWRTRLAEHSSDANRLFWVSKDAPRFLNVGGHESSPRL